MACRAALPVALLTLAVACGGEMTYRVARTVVAPGSGTRALLYNGMGGGAAGVCIQGVLVRPAGAPAPTGAELAAARDSAVFTVSCGSRVGLRWRAADTLEVAYTTDSVGVQVRQRSAAAGGRTRIAYVVGAE
jgi:hypothetical protein